MRNLEALIFPFIQGHLFNPIYPFGILLAYSLMKKMNTTLTFLFTFLLISGLQAQTPIVDYYNLLVDYDDDIKMHKLSQEDGKWYTKTIDGHKVSVMVDAKNDFLEIKDKEKGGTFSLQLSLFKRSNGEVYIGLVKNHMDIFLHGEIHILKLRNGRWNDVTKEVMPTVNYKDFTEQTVGLAAAAYNPQLNHHLEFGYQLPRNDKNPVLACMETQVIEEKCKKKDPTVNEYCASLHELSYSSIELKWQPKKGKFVMGQKQ